MYIYVMLLARYNNNNKVGERATWIFTQKKINGFWYSKKEKKYETEKTIFEVEKITKSSFWVQGFFKNTLLLKNT